MFETNMDEYLDEEVESLKQVFDVICTGWDREVSASILLQYYTPTSLFSIYKKQPNPTNNNNNSLASLLPRIQLRSKGMFLHHSHPSSFCP
jgi:recyclin-1